MLLFTSSRRRACIRSSRCYLTPLTSWIFWCWCHCIPANQTHWSHGCDWCSALQDRETLVWCLMSEWDNWKYRRNPYHNKLLPRCDMTPASLYFVLLSTCWTQTLIIRWCCIYSSSWCCPAEGRCLLDWHAPALQDSENSSGTSSRSLSLHIEDLMSKRMTRSTITL